MTNSIKSIKHKKSTIISKGSDKPKSDKSTHYVSNAELYSAFVDWYGKIEEAKELGKPEPEMPVVISKSLVSIAQNLAKKSNWYHVSHLKDEMIGNAIENCIKCVKNFDIERTKNPFSYFTQTSYYAFLRTIDDEQELDYVKHKSMLLAMTRNGLHTSLDVSNLDEDLDIDTLDYNQESVDKFIKDYEERKFGVSLALDEGAGNAGRRRRIASKTEEDTGIF
jgi:hypothetical protein